MVSATNICTGLKHAGLIRNFESKMIMRMIRELNNICYEELFKGKCVPLPNGMGVLKITKEMQLYPSRIPRFKKHLMPGYEYSINKRAHNPKTGGYVYRFSLVGRDVQRAHICIRMASKYRKRLFKELFYGDFANVI